MILVLNGPNLNLLGKREPDVYGRATLADLEAACRDTGRELGVDVVCRQSNHEGQLIDWLHGAEDEGAMGIVFNPGGYTHVSVAIRDAVAAIDIPVVEVHLSNVHAREPFRQRLLTTGTAMGSITGLGVTGYTLAMQALVRGRAPSSFSH